MDTLNCNSKNTDNIEDIHNINEVLEDLNTDIKHLISNIVPITTDIFNKILYFVLYSSVL